MTARRSPGETLAYAGLFPGPDPANVAASRASPRSTRNRPDPVPPCHFTLRNRRAGWPATAGEILRLKRRFAVTLDTKYDNQYLLLPVVSRISTMAVTLRLTRAGGKKSPFYRVVAADSRSPRDGRFIEQIGVYDPLRTPVEVRLDATRLDHWLSVGAVPSQTVSELIREVRRAAPPAASKPA
jgi:small subunit ribosomal protein S16